MKQLIYVPIIHMSADLGSIAKQVDKRGIAGFGEEFWERHRRTVDSFWNSIVRSFADSDVKGYKIYQDGMVADGEVGQKIIEEGIKAGSKNYQIIDELIKKGATLIQTEDFSLVKKERDRIVKIIKSKSIAEKLISYLIYKLTKNSLLKKRDGYIARRICETLNHGEIGILFIGADHNIIPKLFRKVRIIELKEAEKVKDYQRLLLQRNRSEAEFEKLAEYLTSEAKAYVQEK